MIAMSTALTNTNPYRNLLGHALVMDEKGQPMHKSSGNMIEFNEAADKIGVDVMRWIFATQNPEYNLNFGYSVADEVRRRFYLILWNSYKFFVDYANLSDGGIGEIGEIRDLGVLDRWILANLNKVTLLVNDRLKKYDAMTASRAIESFVVNDLSTWYIRRSRGRVGIRENGGGGGDQGIFLGTLYEVLLTLSRLLAPFMPFISEEIYRNLTGEESVHLTDYPEADVSLIDEELIREMGVVRAFVEQGHAQRKMAEIKLRQPLFKFTYFAGEQLSSELEKILADELNVKKVEFQKSAAGEPKGEIDKEITPELLAEGRVRDLIRQVQQLRKEAGLTLNDRVMIFTPEVPQKKGLVDLLLRQTHAVGVNQGSETKVEVVKS